MKCRMMSLGQKVWEATEKEYKIEYNLPTNTMELGQHEGNEKYLNAILSGLKNSVFVKFISRNTSKQAWDKLKIVYEGAFKAKESKLRTYKGQFESLKMK